MKTRVEKLLPHPTDPTIMMMVSLTVLALDAGQRAEAGLVLVKEKEVEG